MLSLWYVSPLSLSIPPCCAAITVKVYVSVDGGATWLDANDAGPTLLPTDTVLYEYVVNNTGNVSLSNVTLTSGCGDLGTKSAIGTLGVGQSTVITTTPTLANLACQHNIGNVTGNYTDAHGVVSTATSQDPVNVVIAQPGVSPRPLSARRTVGA